MESKPTNITNKQQAGLLAGLLAMLAMVSLVANLLVWQLPVAALLVFVVYLFFHDRLWQLLLLVAPLVTLGPVVGLSITSGWTYDITLSEAMLILLAVVYLLELFLSQRWRTIKLDGLLVILAAYTAWALSTYSSAFDQHNYFGQARVLLFGLLAYFLARQLIDSLPKLEALFVSLAVTAGLLAFELMLKFYSLGFSARFFFDRSSIRVPVGALALAASLLALVLPVVLAAGFASRNRQRRLFFFACFTLGWLAVFMTLGKAAIASLLIGLAVLFVKFREQRLAMMLALAVFLAAAFVFLNPYLAGVGERFNQIFQDSNVAFRATEYQIASRILTEHWLTGVGLGQEPLYYARFFPFEYNELVNNYWLGVLLDTGLIGLALAVAAFLYILRQLWRLFWQIDQLDRPELWYAHGLVASGAVAALNGLAEVTVFALHYALVLWLIIGAGLSFIASKTNENFRYHN